MREREKENLMKFPLCEKENPLSVGSILVVGKKGKEREKKRTPAVWSGNVCGEKTRIKVKKSFNYLSPVKGLRVRP